MIIHLFPTEKFTKDYIDRINKLFDSRNHFFIVYGSKSDSYGIPEIKDYSNVVCVNYIHESIPFSKLLYAERIILHSLFLAYEDLKLILKIQKNNRNKFVWVIWGADLYDAYYTSHSLKGVMQIKPVLKEIVRKKIIRNTSIFVTGTDYDFLRAHYDISNNSAKLIATYTYNFIEKRNTRSIMPRKVMVGHSATPTCRHIDTFSLLSKYSKDIEVYCPLSYPRNEKYVEEVCAVGKKIFGDNFYPMVDFMDYSEYIEFLNTIDIGVFNNNRQQGMGNITNLLFLGKKVYLSSDNTIRLLYPKNQYTIFDMSEIEDSSFLEVLTSHQAESNRERILKRFSDEVFRKEWNEVFSYGKEKK